jgi:hypothetical protein
MLAMPVKKSEKCETQKLFSQGALPQWRDHSDMRVVMHKKSETYRSSNKRRERHRERRQTLQHNNLLHSSESSTHSMEAPKTAWLSRKNRNSIVPRVLRLRQRIERAGGGGGDFVVGVRVAALGQVLQRADAVPVALGDVDAHVSLSPVSPPISVTLPGIVTDLRPLQPSKAVWVGVSRRRRRCDFRTERPRPMTPERNFMPKVLGSSGGVYLYIDISRADSCAKCYPIARLGVPP